ncbi:hypothetical protein J6590_046028 [Homalodisca vitripennis]|nr:hypothetical protein J6590_046028 [Homalodisca vitripennis]
MPIGNLLGIRPLFVRILRAGISLPIAKAIKWYESYPFMFCHEEDAYYINIPLKAPLKKTINVSKLIDEIVKTTTILDLDESLNADGTLQSSEGSKPPIVHGKWDTTRTLPQCVASGHNLGKCTLRLDQYRTLHSKLMKCAASLSSAFGLRMAAICLTLFSNVTFFTYHLYAGKPTSLLLLEIFWFILLVIWICHYSSILRSEVSD